MKPAIVVVGYNRPNDIKRLLNNINGAKYDTDDIPLIISLDKAQNEADIVKIAEEFQWLHGEKIIRTFPERQGLRKHIVQCGDLSEKYGAVIILEDDLLVSPNFYNYVQQAISFYEDEEKVTGFALYSHEWNGYARRNFVPMADAYDVYMGQYSITWGQCWTFKQWSGFKKWYLEHEDRLGDNDKIPANINRWSKQSWGRYFVNYIVEKDLYYVIPRISLSTNCSDVGEHVRNQDNSHQVRLLLSEEKEYVFPKFDKAWHYDIFFENSDLYSYIPEVEDKDALCMNLTGIEKNIDRKYVLSTRSLPYKQVKTYGLQLRPIEMNVLWNIPGEEIILYDTRETNQVPPSSLPHVLKYEIRGFNTRDIKVMFIDALKRSASIKLKGIWRKKK